jgi:hypothetical protein
MTEFRLAMTEVNTNMVTDTVLMGPDSTTTATATATTITAAADAATTSLLLSDLQMLL